MKKKLNFSTLVAFVNVKPNGFVDLLDQINQVKRRREFRYRTKLVSDHRCAPVVTKLLGGEAFDARFFSFTHWLVWASVLEEEGYNSSIIIVPVKNAVKVRTESMRGFDPSYGGRVSFQYFDVREDVASFIGYLQGWINAPRVRYETLNLNAAELPHTVVIGGDLPPMTGSPRESGRVLTPDQIKSLIDEACKRGNAIEVVSIDGKSVELTDKEEVANG